MLELGDGAVAYHQGWGAILQTVVLNACSLLAVSLATLATLAAFKRSTSLTLTR